MGKIKTIYLDIDAVIVNWTKSACESLGVEYPKDFLFPGQNWLENVYAISPRTSKLFPVCDISELTEDTLLEKELHYEKLETSHREYEKHKWKNKTVSFPVIIKSVEWSGGACPYQIKGTTNDDRFFYLRYRGGRLRAGISDREGTFDYFNYNILSETIGDEYDGGCDPELFKKVIGDKIIFPDGFNF